LPYSVAEGVWIDVSLSRQLPSGSPQDVLASDCPEGGEIFGIVGENGGTYSVDSRKGRCTCPEYKHNLPTDDGRERCKHAARVAYATGERSVPTWVDTDGDDDTPAAETTSLAEVAEDPTGYPDVEVEIVDVSRPDSEKAPALKATVLDDSTAMDLIAWDDPDILDASEGDRVLLENVATTEFDAQVQLQIKPGVTQQTVMMASHGADSEDDGGPDTDADSGERATADGGVTADTRHVEADDGDADSSDETANSDGSRPWTTVDDDMTGPGPNAQRIADWIDYKPDTKYRRVNLLQLLTQDIEVMTREEFEAAVEKGTTEGTLIEVDGKLKDAR
jgi:SWIM zinc finger.